MICFTLCCAKDHRFDSWFASSGAYETLAASGKIACPNCGDVQVSKALMTPAIGVKANKAQTESDNPAQSSPITANAALQRQRLSSPQTDVERALAEMRRHVEENSDYVGLNFAAEARKIHEGEAPARAIYGEASTDEARALISDGVPVAPLPFMPRAKVN